MKREETATFIKEGKASLGIEVGSTRIKGVLIGKGYMPVALGEYSWENKYENGIWTYDLEEVWTGLQTCYARLVKDVAGKYGVQLKRVASVGISAMMHGYLPFDKEGTLLTPFRTWRNTMTGQAAEELTKLLDFNIPQRWSLAHLYQALLNKEEHTQKIDFITTLSGYVHWKLTGKKVIGIGDASGMFPIDTLKHDFDKSMLEKFQQAASKLGWKGIVDEILPKVMTAGEIAGTLTEEGAALLDPAGVLRAGIPFAAPEGDAGTGMVATNSVAVRTGNISAGTSVFSMVVLEKQLSSMYEEIDMVTTPAGNPVAMVHCNNCTNEINAWARVLKEFLEALGQTTDMNQIFTAMFTSAVQAETDCGGLLIYNYLSGEPLTGLSAGRPLLVRSPQARLTFSNFMLSQLYSAVASLNIGMEILEREQVKIDKLYGHGGFFKTPVIGQRVMAAALNAPVSVMDTAGEGGAWGMALLAAYMTDKEEEEKLEDFLEKRVFANQTAVSQSPDTNLQKGFERFMEQYKKGLYIEIEAVERI